MAASFVAILSDKNPLEIEPATADAERLLDIRSAILQVSYLPRQMQSKQCPPPAPSSQDHGAEREEARKEGCTVRV